MTDDHVYLSLAEASPEGDSRWAFGTGFEDPLHGVDTALPAGLDAAALAVLCLGLGDDALVAAQRLAEWVTRAPELEEEVALANIGLDLLGQARLLLSRAGQAEAAAGGAPRSEDDLAYFRGPQEFRNVLLAELPNGDFAHCVVRLLVFSSWRLAAFQALAAHPDPVLAAVAAKGVSELAYHRDHAAQWTLRLGDGTEESRRRMLSALDEVWPYLPELLDGADPAVSADVEQTLRQVLDAATLPEPSAAALPTPLPGRGRAGEHTPHLAPLLAELQSVARADPEATW
ncbi:phenylacetate-CoA oxygenase subunit PaaC [Streptacidiphilus sp. PB12-B1b]|uniref:1,2-phenylacetyl-CoA epoxidase subunit PaaC n=1 Tax=Streptacidiphilus sp. PB12-B1b TaxID=2705012 RepID=UPI0015FE0BC9|nr:1,2-phenylacetyl-CoA epoxidase subunit PaaC [Streptacidiphilus sp. PB12-B1b]QMU80401.1 phenylacetate-CoA oxygenase subunit PaaC [Streptacidiphilus sp. PB12-B1b]